jgi:ribonucleoside-triphosphate reductase
MLSSLGIKSYITSSRKPKTIKFENGTFICKPSFQLSITQGSDKFLERIGFIQYYKMSALERMCDAKKVFADKISFNIQRVNELCEQEVYDITVDDPEHTYWTGGVLVSNCGEANLENGESCNLQNLPLMNLDSEEEFVEAARLMHRYGKRVTLEHYHHPISEEVIKRNRRIGTSITGCLASPLFTPKILDRVYGEIQKENVFYSKKLDIPESIRTTTINPGGTFSKMFDQEGYEGIHPAFSRYIIQRIRFASTDPLIPLLRKSGHKIEPQMRFDGSLDQSTLVVDFYVQAPNNQPVADEDWDTWKQLDVVKMVQQYWADQAVSVTVYYKKDEIPELKVWLADNLQYLKTISFLCQDDHGFLQAPKEKITEEQFNKLSVKIKPIDVELIGNGFELLSSLECAGGVCPVR